MGDIDLTRDTPKPDVPTVPLRIVAAIGTRPDVLKMLPVVLALKELGADVEVWWSGQGKDMFPAEHQYLITKAEKYICWDNLAEGIAETINRFSNFLRREGDAYEHKYPQNTVPLDLGLPVDVVLVHGDDATAYSCAVASFLEGVPVAHVEAGLRTYNKEPYPEEAFRRMIGAVATWHFAPDQTAARNVIRENSGAPNYQGDIVNARHEWETYGIFIVGNTINDTLPKKPFKVLATLHRRENWGERRKEAMKVLGDFVQNDNVEVSVIRHPNWDMDGFQSRVACLAPLSHDELIEMIQEVDLVVTDSGGLQEEAAFLGTPCICVRTSTERTTLVENGAVELVHPDRPEELRAALDRHLNRRYAYGRGNTSEKIAEILMGELK